MSLLTRVVGLAAVLACLVTPAPGQETARSENVVPPPVVELVELEQDDFGDPLEAVLGIETVKGRFRLSQAVREVRLRIDFYRGGKKVETVATGHTTTPGEASADGRFALHIADLDHLRLGDGRAGHSRFRWSGRFDKVGSTFGTRSDIPKSVFDRSLGRSRRVFRPRNDVPGEEPLFYVLGLHAEGDQVVRGGGETPAEVVRINPEADVAVVVLEFGGGER